MLFATGIRPCVSSLIITTQTWLLICNDLPEGVKQMARRQHATQVRLAKLWAPSGKVHSPTSTKEHSSDPAHVQRYFGEHVSSIDFAILSAFVFEPIREDMCRRGWWDESLPVGQNNVAVPTEALQPSTATVAPP